MKRKPAIIVAAAILASLLVGLVIGQVLLTRQIDSTMRMLGAADFHLVGEDIPYPFPEDISPYVVDSIAWGDFVPLQSKDSETLLGARICILNLGNIGIIIGWNYTGLDETRWSLTATWADNPYPINDYNQFSIAPGGMNGYMTFYLESTDPYAAPLDEGFTMSFHAMATP